MFMSIAPRCALSPRRCKIYCVKKAPPRLYLPAQIYRLIGFTGSFALCPSCTRARLLGGGTTPVHNRK